ncbi:MAG: DUF1738 domain-containing protein, partial [Proteobacteria bacterium]|nr:DUF1738 domain-containing protein [Pseudomonadota bacterium]
MDLPTYRQQQAHKFYEQLSHSTSPLFLGWKSAEEPLPQIGGEPRGVSGYPYRGDNAVFLMMAAREHGFTSPYWMTFDQARACGGSVKRGELGTKILSWTGKEGEYKPVLMSVFNGAQLSGISFPPPRELMEEAQRVRQAGLDSLVPPRKRRPSPLNYVARLRERMNECFPEEIHEQSRAQSALRRELAMMTACARLGLPREVDGALALALKPFAAMRPNWREVVEAIDDAGRALSDLGILPLMF